LSVKMGKAKLLEQRSDLNEERSGEKDVLALRGRAVD